MPEVSVIIPAYNAERFIAQTIESVLRQTYRDFEVIVIDDGSSDRTAEILESFGLLVRYIFKKNEGVSIARNTGIENSVGKYIAFLDADDLWEPTKLENQVRCLNEHENVGLCFTGVKRIDIGLQEIGETPAVNYSDFCEALLLYSCVVSGSCSSAMIRRALTQTAGVFNPSYSTCADWEYWIRLSQVTRFAAINQPLVKYRVSPSSMSSDPALVEKDTLGVLDDFFSLSQPEMYARLKNRCYSNHWMILSGCYLHAGRIADSLRCLVEGVRRSPQNIVRPLGLPQRWLKRWILSNPLLS